MDKRYYIHNATDNIPCDFNREYNTIEEAEEGIKRLRMGFEKQGYYRTNTLEKIAIEDIKYEIKEI